MAKEYGQEYPERGLMATLSDLLGIPHFTTSRGATVRKDFLVAVASALGVRDPEGLGKDELIRATWEAANHGSMPESKLSIGGTVTNQVLQDIHDGVLRHGVPGRIGPADPAYEPADDGLLAAEFDPSSLSDTRDRRLARIAQREGQDRFRQEVLRAYGEKCAISRFDQAMTLQAAHISPHRGKAFNVVPNGLCLRADLHILFDRGAIAIHEKTSAVLVKPHLLVGAYADVLAGANFTPPTSQRDRPSVPALRAHRLWAGFED